MNKLNYTKEAEKNLDNIKEYVLHYNYYQVACDQCDNEAEEKETASEAAEVAWEEGFRIILLGNNEGIFCKECVEGKVYKKWRQQWL